MRPSIDTHPPREISDGVFWLGGCTETKLVTGELIHIHSSAYLLVGPEQSLLVDTGNPRDGQLVLDSVAAALDGRTLDWILPTHPELAHAGSLQRLLDQFPTSRALVCSDDFRLIWPSYEQRMLRVVPGDSIDLGGSRTFHVLSALIKDLPATVWGYDTGARVHFVSDGCAYSHGLSADDEPAHRPGQCRLMASELEILPTVDQAGFITKAALYWSHYRHVADLIDEFEKRMEEYPPSLIAPGHGNVIDNIDEVVPIFIEAHRRALAG